MELNDLFLKTLQDLREKTKSHDAYKIFMSAALLRKLLLDNNPLVNEVNRKYKIRILFKINDRKPLIMEGLTFWTIQDGFDPETAHVSNPINVNKEKMLNKQVMIALGKTFTVHELIDFLCHIKGAVHYNNLKEEKELLLSEIEKSISMGGISPLTRSLLAINRVVLKGLKSLEDVVKEDA